MKKIKCKDVGMVCPFEAHGEDAQDVKMKMMEHAMSVHAKEMEGMSEDEKKSMEKMMDEKMTDE